jgi:hypothetical protein
MVSKRSVSSCNGSMYGIVQGPVQDSGKSPSPVDAADVEADQVSFAPMAGPQRGDLIVRNVVTGGFEVIDVDGKHVNGTFDTFIAAYQRARVEAKGDVWQQVVDQRGRPCGWPGRVTPGG